MIQKENLVIGTPKNNMVQQFSIQLPHYGRGFHLITRHLKEHLTSLPDKGIIHIFIQHTSAAIAINENADPDVRYDFETFMNRLIPDGHSSFSHILEGADDMPAHIKSSLFGQSITIPITKNDINLGTWQGIYLCEFRTGGDRRNLVITIIGE